MKAYCWHCERVWTLGDVHTIKDYEQRVADGDAEPNGQCPSCGWLTYPQIQAAYARAKAKSPRRTTKTFIVEVDNFEGADTAISVRRTHAFSINPDAEEVTALYCVGQLGPDGVVRFIDWGYRTVAEAKAAWPEAQ